MTSVDVINEWLDTKQQIPKKFCCSEHRAGWTSLCLLIITATGLSLIAWWEYEINVRLKAFDLNYKDSKHFGVIADIHLDTLSNWTHCQNGSFWNGEWISHYANKYGGRFCDTPRALLDLTLLNLKNYERSFQPFEFLIILGDNSGHFSEGVVQSVEELKYLRNSLNNFFPSIPVYFTLGNHDLSTTHSQLPSNPQSWYQTFWDTMSPSLHKKENKITEAMKTFKYYGFYKVEHDESLWVVSLNTNIFMTTVHDIDEMINAQLLWLNETLIEANNLGSVSVLLIGHSSPDIAFTELPTWFQTKEMVWSPQSINAFNQIVAAHWEIIRLPFYAHQHTNSFFTKKFTPRDFISFIKFPSLSMSDFGHPSFSVGIVNEKNWELLDFLFYFCPVEIFTRSNREPKFSFQYSFKQQYFPYQDKYKPINSPAIEEVINRIIEFGDGMETYTNILMNVYQLSFKPHISIYEAFCIMTENQSNLLEKCLQKYS